MTKELIQEMFKMQEQFNELAVPSWRDKNLDWETAILVETSELLESLDYKWWKNGEIDWDNAKVELVDVWHFFMSYIMVNTTSLQQEQIIDYIIRDFNDSDELEKYDNKALTTISKYFIKNLLDNEDFSRECIFSDINSVARNFNSMMKILDFDYTSLYKAYVVKNTLNHFRKSNGYKEGTYIKEWFGKEDNVHAYQIANELKINENFVKYLENSLYNVYQEVKEQNQIQNTGE